MFTYKSTQFNMEGFALVLGASFIGGIRWTLTQMLLQKAELGESGACSSGGRRAGRPGAYPCRHSVGLQNPIDTMFHLQPLMFLGLFPLFAVFEGRLGRPPRGPSVQQIPSPGPEPSAVVAAKNTSQRGGPSPCMLGDWTDT